MLNVKVRLPNDQSDPRNFVIESVDAEDEGRYLCRASNSLGRAQAFADVNMLGTHTAVTFHSLIHSFHLLEENT